MKLEKFSVSAEILGSVAVVITLIFLLVELRENTAAVQATNLQSIAERVEARMMLLATDSELTRLVMLADEPGEIERGSIEWEQLRYFYLALLTAGEEAYLQYRQGFLEEDFFLGRARRALGPLDNPIGRETYRRVREIGSYEPEYIEWVDETYGYGSEENAGSQAVE